MLFKLYILAPTDFCSQCPAAVKVAMNQYSIPLAEDNCDDDGNIDHCATKLSISAKFDSQTDRLYIIYY